MTIKTQRLFFRPTPTPSVDVPLGARSVGHYKVDADFSEPPAKKHFVQLFWGIRGCGTFVIDGVEKSLAPGFIAIYFPGMVHDISSGSDEWEYRWWTMDGPLAVPLATGFGLARADLYETGPAPVELFEELEEAIAATSTPASERYASAVAFKLLAHAAGGKRADTPRDPRIQESLRIMQNEWSDPMLGVESLSARVGMDRSVFSRRFHAAMGIAPVKYIGNLRLQNALSLLKQGTERISSISRTCGWSDPNYFSRRIRAATGQSPEEFRRS